MSEIKSKIGKKTMIIIIGLLIAVLAAGLTWWWIHSHRVVSTDDARVKGTIVAVSPKVSGRIEKVLVTDGDHVEAGQIIAVLEKQEYEAQVEQAQGNLAALQAKLAAIKAGNRPQEVAQASAAVAQQSANLNNIKKNAERAEGLYQQGAISEQQRDSAQTSLEVAEAQYTSAGQSYNLSMEGSRAEDIAMAKAQVLQAQAVLKSTQIQLDNVIIKAPVPGTIALKSVEDGEIVAAGQPLFSVANLDDIWIESNIEETYIGKVKVGQLVDFTVDAYSGEKFSGEVIAVGPAAGSQLTLLPAENSSGNFTKTTQRLPVKIKAFPHEEFSLKPGMSTIVNIYIK
jgi:multidrug resistance efflux pump